MKRYEKREDGGKDESSSYSCFCNIDRKSEKYTMSYITSLLTRK
jgi:hypothetical protein